MIYKRWLSTCTCNTVHTDKKRNEIEKICIRNINSHFFVFCYTEPYEGPAKSFVTGFGLLQCYVLSNIFLLQTFKVFPSLLKHIFVTFLPSREKQINTILLLVSVGETDK